MIAWLLELNREMRSLGYSEKLPPEQIDALSLSAITVSDICEKFVPHAPKPVLEQEPPEPDDLPSLRFGWMNQRLMRALTLVATADGRISLCLLDTSVSPVRATHDHDFTYEQLKSAIVAFFDGWVPHA